jgi:hypothetical protein
METSDLGKILRQVSDTTPFLALRTRGLFQGRSLKQARGVQTVSR